MSISKEEAPAQWEEGGSKSRGCVRSAPQFRRKSPYHPCPPDVPLTLVHSKNRSVVAALDVGPEGAPYPDRRVVAGDEVGWEDNGCFVPDPMFPRRVRLGHPKTCGGFEVGPTGAAYPERMTMRLRWDEADVGFTEEIEGRPGRYRFVLRHCVELRAPFGGLSHEELCASHCRNLSAAACMTLLDVYDAAASAAHSAAAAAGENEK